MGEQDNVEKKTPSTDPAEKLFMRCMNAEVVRCAQSVTDTALIL